MSEVKIPVVNIEIDGKPLQVTQGSMIIEAADDAGIVIPRFCYHKKLAIAANCRMCLVDAENSRKPIPACATPVTEGMKIYTKSPKALQYQKTIMEFLLINHPLDCPICDQGGECELQDMSMAYGKDVSRYNQGKRSVVDKDIGPLVSTDLTRCIHCTRCVRFGAEIAGEREVGMLNRGEHSEIASFLSRPLESEMSGNIIDLCPVGALTSKPFRYRARAWELQQKPSIASHDCVGSNTYVHVRRGEAMRVVPRENEAINEVWISDRDRFSYEGVTHPARAQQPLLKQNGQWQEVSWSQAFEFVAKQLKQVNPTQIGGLASASSTTEELYLFQKVLRGLGCDNIDHRLRRRDFSGQSQESTYPGINGSLADIENADVIILIGSNVRKEQPIIHHRIRKASLNDAKIFAINPAAFDFRFVQLTQQVVNSDDMVLEVAGLLKALLAKAGQAALVPVEVEALLATVDVSGATEQMAEQLRTAQHPVILSGALAHHLPQAGILSGLVYWLMKVTKALGGQLTDGANSAGAYLAGVLPHRAPGGIARNTIGLNAADMLATHEGLQAYLLLNVEPHLDSAYGQRAMNALSEAKCVIALSSFVTPGLQQYAHVILPISTLFETSGTLVNVCGEWQSTIGVAKAPGEARPAWKVLRVLANFLELPDFNYASSEEVLEELKVLIANHTNQTANPILPKRLNTKQTVLRRVAEVPMYSVDAVLRHTAALQATHEAQQPIAVRIAPALAKQLKVNEGDLVLIQQNNGASLTLPVDIVEGIADKTVFIPMGVPEVARLGEAFGEISVLKV